MPNPIQLNEHVFVAGITGGGKSRLTRAYLSQFPKVIKLDTKGEALDEIRAKKNPWPEVPAKELVIVERLEDLIKTDHPYRIYCPAFDELEQEVFNEFFRWIYFDMRGKKVATWVDELMEVSESSQTIPRYLKALYTRGRSRLTPVWGLTQRPVGVHPICMSQSTHVFAFDLPLDQDRKKVADATGCKEFLEMPHGYNFWYYQRGFRNAVKGVLKERG